MWNDKPIEPRRGFYAEFWHDYSSFLPGMNWRNFCVIHANVEYNPMMGQVEWEFCLLGLWYRGTYVYNTHTDMRQHLAEIIDNLDNNRTAFTLEDNDD